MPTSPMVRGLPRQLARTIVVTCTALLLVTCTDSPVGPGRGGIGYVRLQPVFPAHSQAVSLTLDKVRVVVIRAPADTLADVSKQVPLNATQVRLDIPVRLQQNSENLEVHLELYAGTTLLFDGMSTVTVTTGTGNPVAPIALTYQGPGANIATVTLAPRDTTVLLGGSFDFRVSAADSQQAPVAQFYVSWSATGGSIDPAGRFTAPSARDTVLVAVVTPTGIVDTTQVFVTALPAQLVYVSGSQNGSTGARLAQPLVVRVDGSDGRPLQGVVVTFAAVIGGGSVDSATYVTDAQGLARMGATLGLTVGQQTFSATAPGLGTVTFSMTAASSGVRVWTGAMDRDWNTPGNWAPNAIPTAGDSVAVPLASNRPILTGNATIRVLTMQGGVGSNNAVVVAGNLTVSGNVSLPDTNSFISFTSGQFTAGSVTLAGFQAYIDVSQGSASVSGPITITGNRAFFEAGPGSALGAVTLSGNQAFLSHYGGTQGPVTASGTSAFWEAGGTVTVTGAPAIQLSGTAFLTSFAAPVAVTINGDVTVGGTGAFFNPSGGDHWTINGNLQTTGGGVLRMNQGTDTVDVNGNISFGGGDESTQLTAGMLFVSGNFTQTGLATSFVGTGTHVVFLDGSGAQTLNFASPGFGASRFQNVIIANSAGLVTATSDIYSTGTAGVTPTAVRTLSGNGSTLFTTILNVSNFTFNNLLLNFAGSTVVTFDTVTFQGYAPTATPLTIAHPGAASPLPFLNISFTVTPTTGFYLNATDNNPTDGVPLVIDMLNPSPASPGGRVQTAGGATVNWTGTGPVIYTWTGAVSADWSTAGNWGPTGVPGASDDAVLTAAGQAPVLTTSVSVTNVTVPNGVTLSLGGNTLTASGNVNAGTTITNGTLVMTGSGTTVQGTVPNLFISLANVTDAVTVAGPLTATSITVDGGRLVVGGQTVTVSGNFATANIGLLAMTNPADQVTVNGNSTFGGEDPTGQMTAGILRLRGSLYQTVGVSFGSLVATGSHKVILDGTSGQVVQFASPGQSRLQDLELATTTGVSFFSAATITGQLSEQMGPTVPVTSAGGFTVTVGGLDLDGVDLGGLLLDVGAGSITRFDNARFVNYPETAIALRIRRPSGVFTFNNLIFGNTAQGGAPTTGLYLQADDIAPTDGQALTINLVNPIPATDGGHSQALNGAVINWPGASPALTWVGTTNDWHTPSNWFPAGVPTSTTDVTIASGTPNAPSITTSAAVRNLTVANGARLDVNGGSFTVNGDFDLSPGTAVVTVDPLLAALFLDGTGKTMRGIVSNVSVRGTYTLSGLVDIANDLIIRGTLTVNGQGVAVGGTLSLLSAGTLVMQDPLDYVRVGGNAFFTGGSTAGLMTEGVLELKGNLTQNNSGTGNPSNSFSPSGNHITRFSGTGTQAVDIFNTGQGSGLSHFANLELAPTLPNTVDFTRFNTVFVEGQLTSNPQASPTLITSTNGAQLSVVGVFVTALNVGLPLTINGGTIQQFDNVTFGGIPGTATQLTVNHPGAAGPFVFDRLTFGNAPTSGLYLRANDTDGASPDVLTIDLANPSPATDGGFSQGVNGAVIRWPGPKKWNGSVSVNWNDPVNWTPAGVPSGADDVTIPSGTPFSPQSSSGNAAKTLTVNPGAVLDLGGILQVGGNVFADGAITGPSVVKISALAQVRGTISNLEVDAPTQVVGGLTLTTDLGVQFASGVLTLGGYTITVGGSLFTSSQGTIVMTNPADLLAIGGNVSFAGGDETGLLTAGTIQVAGNFSQTVSTFAFVASGTHTVVFTGAGAHTLGFSDPGPNASHFQNLDVSQATGGIAVGGASVSGQLISTPGAGTPIISASVPTSFIVAGVNVTRLQVDRVLLQIGGLVNGPVTAFDNVSFINMDPTAAQLAVNHPGAATPFTFNNLSFAVTPTTGVYLTANDRDGALPDALTINMVGATPAAPAPSLFSATNGAVITWPAASPMVTWTGASANWNDPASWSTGQVPTTTDDVTIPLVVNQPALSANAAVRNLTLQNGVSIQLTGFILDVSGDLVSTGTSSSPAPGLLRLSGTSRSVSGAFGATVISVTGSYTLAGRTSAQAALIGGTGSLVIGGQTLSIGGFQATSSGTLTMTNPADSVIIAGTTTTLFNGGSEQGLLTAGVLMVGGNFFGAGTRFEASGTHRTVFTAPSQVVQLQSGGQAPGTSHFQEMAWVGGGTLSLSPGQTPYVLGQMTVNAAGTITTTVSPVALHVGTLANSGLVTLAGVQLVIEPTAPVPITLSNLTFTVGSAITPLFLRHPGLPSGGTLIIDQVTFTDVPTLPAVYLDVDDTSPADGNVVIVDVTNSSPATPGGLVSTANGAIVNWPPVAPVITWTGGAGTDWNFAGNWSGGAVPTASDDVTIPAGGNQPVLTATAQAFARNLTVQPSAVLDLGNFALFLTGGVSNAGTVTATPGTGGLSLSGTGTIEGLFNTLMLVNGPYSLSARAHVVHLSINGPASDLNLGGHTLEVDSVFTTGGGGTLTMQQAGDSLLAQDLFFDGGSTAGRLTAGTIVATGTPGGGGNLVQNATNSTSSFAASGTHKVLFNGYGGNATMLSPGASHFQNLEVATGPAGMGIGLRVDVQGNLSVTTATSVSGDTLAVAGNIVTAVGSGLGVSDLLVGGLLGVNGGYSVFNTVFNGNGQSLPPNLPYTNIIVDQTGTGQPGFLAGSVVNVSGDFTLLNTNGQQFYLGDDLTVGGNILLFGTSIFDPAGFNVDVTGSLSLQGSATLANGTSGIITIGGSLYPQGGKPIGPSGINIALAGDFNQAGFTAPDNWVDGVTFIGAGIQTVIFTTPGPTQARFGSMTISKGGGAVLLQSNAFANSVDVAADTLDLGGYTLTVSGVFGTSGTGVLKMTLPSDALTVNGNANFGGANELGNMSDGVLAIGGNLTQDNGTSNDSFHPSGNHLTILNGASPTVTFASPNNIPGSSHFERVRWTGNGTLTLGSDVYAHNLFQTLAGANGTISGGAVQRRLHVGTLNIDGATFNRVGVDVTEQGIAPQFFNNITFTNYPTTNALVLSLNLVGGTPSARPLTFDNVDFAQQLGIGANNLYVQLTQQFGAGIDLTLSNSNQGAIAGGNGASLSSATVPNTISWP